jgi:predicted nuclease with RNAse H fold
MTAAPDAANASAVARPIPRDAPVTSATLPSNRMSIGPTLGSTVVAARVLGIDLGASAIWSVAAERGRDGWLVTGGAVHPPDEIRSLVAAHPGATVAIDAPGGPSERLHLADDGLARKFQVARCAEVALRLDGYAVSWVAPGPDDLVPGWVQVGFEVWATFRAAGTEPLEVFPHAAFAVLLGRRPPNKQTVAGRRARLDVLGGHLVLPHPARLWGHDAIDAAIAAVVATHHVEGRARRLTCADHETSAMWQPAMPG